MSVGLLLRERTSRSVTFSLSLSLACATNERCARLYQYLSLSRRRRRFRRRRWSKSKEKASGRSWETRESRESVLGTRGRLGNPQEKPRGDSVGERYIQLLLFFFFLRGFFDDDFSSSSRFGRTETRKRDGDQVSEREERLDELSDRN